MRLTLPGGTPRTTFSIPGSDRLAATSVHFCGRVVKGCTFQYPRFGSFGCNAAMVVFRAPKFSFLSVSPVRIVWLQQIEKSCRWARAYGPFSIPGSDRLAATLLNLPHTPFRRVFQYPRFGSFGCNKSGMLEASKRPPPFQYPRFGSFGCNVAIECYDIERLIRFQYPRFGSFGCNAAEWECVPKGAATLSVSPVRIVWLQPLGPATTE